MSTAIPFHQHFPTAPAANFEEFKQALFEAYGTRFTTLGPYAGPSMYLDDVAWAALPNNMITDPINPDGPQIPRPRVQLSDDNVHVPLPTQPNGNTSNAGVAFYRIAYDNAIRDNADATELHARFVASLPEEAKTLLRVPNSGLATVPVSRMYAHCLQAYGTLRAQDLLDIQARLALPMTNDETYLDVITRQTAANQHLAASNQSNSSHLQVQYLADAFAHVPHISEIVRNYFTAHPTVSGRNFPDLCAYLRQHVPNVQAKVSSMGYSAAALEDSIVSRILERLQPALPTTQATASANAGVARPKAPRQTRPAKPAGTASTNPTTPAYCWYHGYGTHSGNDCKAMAKDSTYGHAHKSATSPINVGGVKGSAANLKSNA